MYKGEIFGMMVWGSHLIILDAQEMADKFFLNMIYFIKGPTFITKFFPGIYKNPIACNKIFFTENNNDFRGI